MGRLLLSAAHKSSGKTTITTGLCRALHARGLRVQPFKKGPDYIDPMWLKLAAGRSCYNLDFNTSATTEMCDLFVHKSGPADIALIEGNKGLHDGMARDGSNSNAALAKLLNTPVVLVLDTRGITRGIAPLILGYQAFDPDVQIAGIILNQVGGPRHEAKLRDAVEYHTGLPILGAVHKDPELHITERHLGLVPSNESREATAIIDRITRAISEQVDLDTLLEVAGQVDPLPPEVVPEVRQNPTPDVRIAVAQDAAFGFYYADDLEAMEAAGAELVPLNTLHDQQLPDVDGLFIGGGFPEAHIKELEANRALRESIRNAVEQGLSTYAECGGLMYLTRSIHWNDSSGEMVGVIPADTIMHKRPQGRGYVKLEETGLSSWCLGNKSNDNLFCAHEFHYSRLENIGDSLEFAYQVARGVGIGGGRDGILYKNLVANYAHLRHGGNNRWTDHFIDFVRKQKHKF